MQYILARECFVAVITKAVLDSAFYWKQRNNSFVKLHPDDRVTQKGDPNYEFRAGELPAYQFERAADPVER